MSTSFTPEPRGDNVAKRKLLTSPTENLVHKISLAAGQGFLLLITSASALAVLFIFAFIIRDALPFFHLREGFMGGDFSEFFAKTKEFFTSTRWYPSNEVPEFGALAIIVGSILVTLGAVLVAAPLGVAAAVCLSDVLPFAVRQYVKPVIEILAAIPSVAYGFFALVVFAPLLQDNGGLLLTIVLWLLGLPLAGVAALVLGDVLGGHFAPSVRRRAQVLLGLGSLVVAVAGLFLLSRLTMAIEISSGTNALNVSLILAIMALPTIVSVSEDALSAVGRDMREGSLALGATRAESLIKVVIPAASSGIFAAILLGVMRAIGETMVVWMASGNSSKIPEPWWDLLEPVRTLTATIAGDMGEADHVTGSDRYHVLFVMGLCLLSFSFLCNLISEWAVRRQKKRSSA